eukprot:TRINITY_DN7565_c0_g1_i1.p2 TRINITY_DN7565_c0_g1~~TRINITY_DN7565_c0_g1_i1.p2  ORF type:complete len:196 (-),score=41.63 TRINITY_DN7565_c0_g1_i1:1184-1771(-)
MEVQQVEKWEQMYQKSVDSPWTKPDEVLQAEVNTLEKGVALDLGCGEGQESLWLASQGWKVVAVDFSPTAINTVQRLAKEKNLEITTVVEDIRKFESDTQFDLVILMYIHFDEESRIQLLNNAIKHLKKNGSLIFIGCSQAESGIPAELIASADVIVGQMNGVEIVKKEEKIRLIECNEESFESKCMLIHAKKIE